MYKQDFVDMLKKPTKRNFKTLQLFQLQFSSEENKTSR